MEPEDRDDMRDGMEKVLDELYHRCATDSTSILGTDVVLRTDLETEVDALVGEIRRGNWDV